MAKEKNKEKTARRKTRNTNKKKKKKEKKEEEKQKGEKNLQSLIQLREPRMGFVGLVYWWMLGPLGQPRVL
jgi:hypothetical protein